MLRRAGAFGFGMALLFAAVLPASGDTVVTFDNGAEGWSGVGFIDALGGNPGRHWHIINPDTFGITLSNNSNPAFVADYTANPQVTLSVDLKVEDINFFGSPVSRPWLVELRDIDGAEPGWPWTSVWFKFTDVSEANTGDWTTFEVTIEDTSAIDLPPGWQGYGAETPLGEPILPPTRTFTDVLASIDEVAYTTFEPGFFFGFTSFDLRIDNITICIPSTCPADLNGDNMVNAADLALLLGAWGPNPGHPADFNADGIVNAADLALLLGGWGPC